MPHIGLARTVQESHGCAPCSPHTLQRTFVSELLDADADISAAQKLASYWSPTTTAHYDRRGERVMKRAAEMLLAPYTTKQWKITVNDQRPETDA